MCRPAFAAVCVATFLSHPHPAGADPTPVENYRQAERLVRQLGAASFADRLGAQQKLLKLGAPARPALLEGRLDPDPEISRRCRRLLPELDRRRFKELVAEFLKDPKGGPMEGLPLAAAYRRMAGDSVRARLLFAGILESAGSHLVRAAGGRLDARAAYRRLSGDLYATARVRRESGSLKLGHGAAFLLLGTLPGARGVTVPSTQVSVALRSTPVYGALGESGREALRRLFVAWGVNQTDQYALYQVLYLGLRRDIPGTLPVAERAVRENLGTQYTRAYAMLAVGKFGSRKQLPLLKARFKDQTQVGRPTPSRPECRLGDVAMGMAVLLSKGKLADYGFKAAAGQPDPFANYYNFGFKDDKARDAARRRVLKLIGG